MSTEDIEYIGDYKEFPTKESALDWLDNYLSLDERNNLIRALKQEPFINKPCVSSGVCEHDKNKVLGKIRAEINGIEINGQIDEHTMFIRTGEQVKQMTLDIIDKYRGDRNETDN